MSRPFFPFPALVAACLLGGSAWLFSQKVSIHTAEAPLPPEEAARSMRVPVGFEVTLFAGEPDVRQPTAFSIDHRGRLWVAENYSYPHHTDDPAADRILVLEDSNGDGRHDKRTVFYEGLNYVTGIETGFGGVWVMSPPYFYFIPDRDGDDVPDGEPHVVLDGFGNHANSHNLANGFAWGPDGWLYATHGRTNWSMIGKPGTPEAERERFDGGVWRYHPVRGVWEPFADGTTNPWGIDWDDWGQGFVSNCVNPHLFHVIQGAHYEPWRGRESSQYAYRRIETIADHFHYTGSSTQVTGGLGTEAEDLAGGGHAHSGILVYLGDNFPESYRNGIFMNNIHGRRINHDVPARSGSGYVASHAPDLMRSGDPWFMGVSLRLGPAGEVYASDWSDTGECHSVRQTHRESGRLYRIARGRLQRPPVDVAALSVDELADAHLHRNDWWVRHARRALQERQATGADIVPAQAALREMLATHEDGTRRLRALWTLWATTALSGDELLALLDDDDEHLRAWAVQLLCEDRAPSAAALEKFALLAASDPSPVVRLYLASALQRLPSAQRWPVAEGLASRAEDAGDQNLPLMLWYGTEPLVREDPARFVALAEASRIPLQRIHAARRVADLPETERPAALDLLFASLGRIDDARRAEYFQGLFEGLEGQRRLAMPDSWPELYEILRESEVRREAVRLALAFDDPRALEETRTLAADPASEIEDRRAALAALLERRPGDLVPLLLVLLDDPALAAEALRGLAAYAHEGTASEILRRYSGYPEALRQDALQTLASRPAWASALLDAVEGGAVERRELTAYTARQIAGLGDRELAQRVEDVWGTLRPGSEEKAAEIARYREQLDPATLAAGDRRAGRAAYQRLCAACHVLFDDGMPVGPDLTGSQRDHLDYLLEHIVDPGASVSRDYQFTLVETADGRVLSGFVAEESERSLVLQSLNERVAIPAGEVVSRRSSPVSMMPEGLLGILSEEERRDLFAYLMGEGQVPLPEVR